MDSTATPVSGNAASNRALSTRRVTWSSSRIATALTDDRSAVAAAAYEFITGLLVANPHRVGKQLRPPLESRHSARRGTYRVIHGIDDDTRTVTVVDVVHRRDVHRPGR